MMLSVLDQDNKMQGGNIYNHTHIRNGEVEQAMCTLLYNRHVYGHSYTTFFWSI